MSLGGLSFAGYWDAAANVVVGSARVAGAPSFLASGQVNNPQILLVSVAGTTSLDGIASWDVGDWAVNFGFGWGKFAGSSTSSGGGSYVLPAAQPNALGGVKANTGGSNQFVNGISSDGSLIYGTPASSGGGGGGPSTITLTGDVSGSGTTSIATAIGAGVVTNAKRANMAAYTLSGNNTATAAAPADLTVAQVKSLLAYSLPDISGVLQASQFPALTGAVTTTAGSLTTTLTNGAVGFINLANAAVAAATDIFANTSAKLVSVTSLWGSQVPTALSDASTIAVDMSTGINFSVTIAGNRTLGTPTNLKRGQSGVIEVTQDTTGSRTLAFASGWDFGAAGAPTLSTAAGKTDLISYYVLSTSGPVIRAFFGKSA